MVFYSLISFLLGIWILVFQSYEFINSSQSKNEILYTFPIALFHIIFAIWYFKGRNLIPFIRASIGGRFLISMTYLLFLSYYLILDNELMISNRFYTSFICYLALQGSIDLTTAIFSWFKNKPIKMVRQNQRPGLNTPYVNRFYFAIYMILLGIWIFFLPSQFIQFFRLPETLFVNLTQQTFIIGPLQVFSVLILLLAYYNLVAWRFQLLPLIEAGTRGGMFTILFVMVLVILGFFHPLVLLLPAVDLVSIAFVWLRS